MLCGAKNKKGEASRTRYDGQVPRKIKEVNKYEVKILH